MIYTVDLASEDNGLEVVSNWSNEYWGRYLNIDYMVKRSNGESRMDCIQEALRAVTRSMEDGNRFCIGILEEWEL